MLIEFLELKKKKKLLFCIYFLFITFSRFIWTFSRNVLMSLERLKQTFKCFQIIQVVGPKLTVHCLKKCPIGVCFIRVHLGILDVKSFRTTGLYHLSVQIHEELQPIPAER